MARASKKQTKPASGGARLMAAGKRPMTLGWPPASLEKIEAAAERDGRKMTQFVMHYSLKAAEKILAER